MSYRNSRQVTGIVKNVTVSQSCGKWYISIQTESEVSVPVHSSTSIVGLDAGVTKLTTLSVDIHPALKGEDSRLNAAYVSHPIETDLQRAIC